MGTLNTRIKGLSLCRLHRVHVSTCSTSLLAHGDHTPTVSSAKGSLNRTVTQLFYASLAKLYTIRTMNMYYAPVTRISSIVIFTTREMRLADQEKLFTTCSGSTARYLSHNLLPEDEIGSILTHKSS